MFDNAFAVCREMKATSTRCAMFTQKISHLSTRRDFLFAGSEMPLLLAVSRSVFCESVHSEATPLRDGRRLPGRMTELARP